MRGNIFSKLWLVSFLILILNFCNLQAYENKILFKIDNEIITTIDIYHEVKFLKIFNPQINELNDDEQLVISKNSIIRDKIKKTEILNFVEEIKVEDKFLMNLLKQKYSQIEFNSIENFENYLKENDLNIKLIREKFAIELIWNDLVFQKYNSKISIDKKKIKLEILNKPKKDLRELSISEIIFNVSKKSEFEKKYEQILKDIELTGFKNAALIHSVSDSASVGGYIGWIKEDNLNEKIRTKVSDLKKGEFSKPIMTSSGFLIIKVEDVKKYEIDFNLDNEISNLIQFKTNEQLNQFSRLYFNKIKKNVIFNEL
ncbi:peptidylprolyl isomerase [Pelagibacterales bacterium SAG-MED37]|nr:peptidylprolyl isomerase [Pelagibacterales bacterium SAG-MED37]